ncbi:hypothetical protein [Diaphorobacter sp.]|uniref:hypothetical protein n=1 Tax=Diaphorobacter sp. TaxID=1934310 RepID=UPI003D09A0DE
MILAKTPAGQQALRERQGVLSPRQRSAFILFDGKRTLAHVLEATSAMGITHEDVQLMIDQGLLERTASAAPSSSTSASRARAATASLTDAAAPHPAGEGSARSSRERYQTAYPVAAELTASLGLRGFRLNLAVEGSSGFEDLAALAPKIREAVGDMKYARLEQALFA